MNYPDVKTTVKDPKNKITIEILSYRKLTRDEIDFTVGALMRSVKRIRKNTKYTAVTLYGA